MHGSKWRGLETEREPPRQPPTLLYGEDPPRYTIVFASGDTDVERYADQRGFRSSRSLGPGWTVLGPIPDVTREAEQWSTG